MFFEALFTTAKTCKQPKCPEIDEWIFKKAMVHLHNGILCSSEKKKHFCDSTDGPGDYYA